MEGPAAVGYINPNHNRTSPKPFLLFTSQQLFLPTPKPIIVLSMAKLRNMDATQQPFRALMMLQLHELLQSLSHICWFAVMSLYVRWEEKLVTVRASTITNIIVTYCHYIAVVTQYEPWCKLLTTTAYTLISFPYKKA